MKNQFFFMASAAMLMLASCSGSQSQQSQQKYADLECMGLKGQVKEVSTTIAETDDVMAVSNASFDVESFTFDEQGALTSEDNYNFQPEDLTRDDQGRIATKREIEVYGSEDDEFNVYESTYTYEQGMQPTVLDIDVTGASYAIHQEYDYNAEGDMTHSVKNMVYDGYTCSLTNTYTILEKDGQGNWTRRKVETTTVERMLNEAGDWCDAEPQTSTTIEVRQILYW